MSGIEFLLDTNMVIGLLKGQAASLRLLTLDQGMLRGLEKFGV